MVVCLVVVLVHADAARLVLEVEGLFELGSKATKVGMHGATVLGHTGVVQGQSDVCVDVGDLVVLVRLP